MPTYFVKPENALKRAEELLSVGKMEDAVETLHDTIKARRHKTWTKTHESIMLKHVELCVLLRRPHMAKDALFQYKTLTQQVAVKSLETVITHFLELAEQKTEEAQQASIDKVEEVIDDLDQADAPENLLLSAVSGAAAQDRMDRTMLSPWLRFLWDSYRNCLELLRNNAQVEQLYHKIARQSFAFCAKYQRRTEFRKLCEHLRMHLNQIQKHQHLSHGVKLNSAESLALMQDTRLIQLDTSIQMELWQEAYRSAEDVHGMMQLSKEKDKRMVKPASYVNYYDKLALVFFKAGNRLFHAAALLQKYIIFKDMKRTFSAEEAQDQATRVLLATMSIADGAEFPSDLTRHLDIEDVHTANIRLLSNILRLPMTPTRAGIMKEISRLNLPEVANQNARQLYKLLETNFSPLRLAQTVEKELTSLVALEKPEYAQYVDALRSVVAIKAFKQLGQIYETLSLDRIRKVVPFYSPNDLERFLVNASKRRLVQAHVDHRAKCVRFGSTDDATLAGGGDLDLSADTSSDGSQLGADGMRGHLEAIYARLREAVDVLDGAKRRQAILEKLKHNVTVYGYHRKDDYERILSRRKKIEQYKELSERVKADKALQVELEDRKKEEARRAEEIRQLEKRNIEFERLKKAEEQEEIKKRIQRDQIAKLKQSVIYKKIIEEHGEEAVESMDTEQVIQEQLRKLDTERRDQAAKMKAQEKKWDHMVRAMHLEEMKQRKLETDNQLAIAAENWEVYEKERVAKAKEDHEVAVAMYARMQRVRADAVQFLQEVKEAHKEEFSKKFADWKNKLESERQGRLQKRAEQRKKQRREAWIREKENQRMREKDEEERAVREAEQEKQRKRERPQRDDRPPRDDFKESKADNDSDWRSGHVAQPSSQSSMRGGPGRGGPELSGPSPADDAQWGRVGPAGMGASDRNRGAPMRGAADEGPWSRQRVALTGPPSNYRSSAGPYEPDETRRRPDDRPPMAPSKADQEDDWRAGGRVPQAPPARPAGGAAPADQGPWTRAGPPAASEGAGQPAPRVIERVIERDNRPPQSAAGGG
uniref:Eukaryotic translation initiation factor 3 subunit A n=1 Tax=Plectus sambesii TaxID=2011161 RepID=A0A914XEM4_9BILA